MSSNELQALLIEKSMKDDDFRSRLLSNPKATIEAETGQLYPPEVQVKIVEDDPDVLVFHIPKMPAVASGELSDAELEMVVGAWGTAILCPATSTGQVICFRCQRN